MSKVSIPRSSSSRYGLLDWADNHLILKCPSREDSLEFSERPSCGDGLEKRGMVRIGSNSGVGVRDNADGNNGRSHQHHHLVGYNAVKNRVLGFLVFLTVICALLTGVAITGRRIDLSSVFQVLKRTKIPQEEVVVVDTNCGRVIGTVGHGAFVFKVRFLVHFLSLPIRDPFIQ